MWKKQKALGILLALAAPSLAVAAFELPHVFEAGNVISASEMNANFDALATEIAELKEEIEFLSTNQPQALELQISGTISSTAGRFSLSHSPRFVGSWPAVTSGTAQEVPEPGLYLITIDAGVRVDSTSDPLTYSLRIHLGGGSFLIYSQRWSDEVTHTFQFNNGAFVRITDPATQRIGVSIPGSLETTIASGSRLLIQRLGD